MSNDNSHDSNGVKERKEPIRLFRFVSPLTAAEQIERTATYAKDPRTYLEATLGKAIVDEKKDLVCIADEVDKDVYGAGSHKSHFEEHIAKLFGKESGLFFLTGVQAQLAALKFHCQSRNIAAWHSTSHLESAEEKAFQELYGLKRILLGPRGDENPTVDEIKEALSLPENERPAVVLLELPNRELGCKTYSFTELEEISAFCKGAGVKFHLDGARIWEIEPYYQETAGKTFADIAALFDSVYVSFYKGLRSASAGAMLLGNAVLIKEAKIWQRRAGGNGYTLFYEIIDCERGFNENIGTFNSKWKKMCDVQDRIIAATKRFRNNDGKRIVDFVVDPPTCPQVRTLFTEHTTEELMAARDKVDESIGIRVFERIRPKQTLDEMSKAEREAMAETNGNNVKKPEPKVHEIEWFVGTETSKLDTQLFVDGYVRLCEELLAARQEE